MKRVRVTSLHQIISWRVTLSKNSRKRGSLVKYFVVSEKLDKRTSIFVYRPWDRRCQQSVWAFSYLLAIPSLSSNPIPTSPGHSSISNCSPSSDKYVALMLKKYCRIQDKLCQFLSEVYKIYIIVIFLFKSLFYELVGEITTQLSKSETMALFGWQWLLQWYVFCQGLAVYLANSALLKG